MYCSAVLHVVALKDMIYGIVVIPFSVGVEDDPGFTEQVCKCVRENIPTWK